MKSIEQAISESTCHKRVTVCALYEEVYPHVYYALVCESNRCCPPNGVCARLGVSQQRDGYTGTECGSKHAEEVALAALPEGAHPRYAIIYGHIWPCIPCEEKLRAAGVTKIDVKPCGGTGLREAGYLGKQEGGE